MPSDTSAPSFEKALTKVHDRLRRSERKCADHLDALARSYQPTGVGNLTKMPPAAFDGFLSWAIATIGRGICGAVLDWCTEVRAGQGQPARPGNVYFWPGYERSYFGSGRSSLTVSPTSARGRDPSEIAAEPEGDFAVALAAQIRGVGLARHPDHSDRDSLYFRDMNSFWFNTLLRPDQYDPAVFKPGSTHGWFVQDTTGQVPALLSVVIKSEPLPAEIRHTQIGDGLSVELPVTGVGQWAKELRDQIQAVGARASRSFPGWPYPQEGSPADDLRVVLYEVWLTACFSPEAFKPDSPWLSQLLSRYQGLFVDLNIQEQLVRMIKASMLTRTEYEDLVPPTIPYSAWYTMPLYEPFGGSLSDRSLGTAMILSSQPIDMPCLEAIGSWTRTMYQALRHYERQVQSAADAQRELSSAFSHEVGQFSGALQRFIPPLSQIWPGLSKDDDDLFWEIPPFAIIPKPEDLDLIKDWRLCPLPRRFNGLMAVLEAWGDVGQLLRRMDIIAGESVSLDALIEGLRPIIPAIVAARRSIDDVAADSLASALELDADFAAQLGGNSWLAFESAAPQSSIWLLPWELNVERRQVDNIAIVCRLLTATLSNALEHANMDRVVIDARVELRGSSSHAHRLVVTISNERRAPDQKNQKAMTVGVSTQGVAEACLVQLEGALVSFPEDMKDQTPGSAITKFWIPTEHSRGIPKPWIRLK